MSKEQSPAKSQSELSSFLCERPRTPSVARKSTAITLEKRGDYCSRDEQYGVGSVCDLVPYTALLLEPPFVDEAEEGGERGMAG